MSDHMPAREYHEAVELSQIRRYMRYGPEQFKEDWETAVALAQIMAIHGNKKHLERLLKDCFKRITAYSANEPEGRPF